MFDLANLSVFVIAVVLLLVVPGPNMAFVMSHAAAHGWRAGLAAATGITLSDMIMTALVSVGIGALVMSWAPAFDLLRWAGACYLLWLGWNALKSRPAGVDPAPVARVPMASIFARATLNSLFNPKALLFFMVFLPQFVDPSRGNPTLQLIALGALLALIAFIFHLALALFAVALRQRFKGGALAERFGAYGFAAVMAGLAARLMLLDRPH